MFFWLVVIILSYLFFSLSSFGDKLILSGPQTGISATADNSRVLTKPKLYTFYVGILNVLVIFLIPFASFGFPNKMAIAWIILEAIVYILALYAMFIALEKYDVSRVVTTIGAIQPILILLFTWILWGTQNISSMNFLAFAMLVLGSIIISVEKKITVSVQYLILILFSVFMFSLDYVFSKMVFLNQPFLQGLIWMRIFSFLFALLFLLSKDMRKQIFSKKTSLNKRTISLFIFTQSAGGIANILQSLAIALVPIAYLAIINSLRGIQYVFLFMITVFFSLFFPKTFKEDISKKVILQKTIAIILIVSGLGVLVL